MLRGVVGKAIKTEVDNVKYNERNYNRMKKDGLYDFPSYDEISDVRDFDERHKKKAIRASGKVRRSSQRSMEWVEDLLAK
jgi:hypothetical protein